MAFDDPLKATVVAEIAAKIEDNMTKNITPQELREVLTSCLNFAENGEDSDKIIEGAVNLFMSSAESAKLSGIAAGAEVNPSVVSQAEAEAGASSVERIWTALRVKQAILALGGGGGGNRPSLYNVPQTGVFTATAGRLYIVDTTGAPLYCNPPASPNVGDQFGVSDLRRNWDVNNFSVRFFTSSQRFCGDATTAANITMTKQDQCVVFEYTGATYGWIVLSGDVT